MRGLWARGRADGKGPVGHPMVDRKCIRRASRLGWTGPMSTALFFDPDAYTEAHRQAGVAHGPAGLMGRQVAGKEFLDAYLSHASGETLTAVVRARDRADALAQICKAHPASAHRPRRLVTLTEGEFLAAPADVLYIPCPPDAPYAWARQ